MSHIDIRFDNEFKFPKDRREKQFTGILTTTKTAIMNTRYQTQTTEQQHKSMQEQYREHGVSKQTDLFNKEPL